MAILNFPPTAGEPIDGSFTYTSDGVTYSWDGYKWTADTGSGSGDANHNDGPTPPTTGELADQWYNTDDGRLYTYTADSSGTLVWIDASPDSIAGGSGGSGGGPTTPGVRYQQGTITPSVDGGVTLSSNAGFWSRVGNSVSIQYYVSSGGAGGAGAFALTLPYIATDNYSQNGSSTGSVMFESINVGDDKVLSPYVAGGSTIVYLYTQSQLGGDWEALVGSQINNNASFFIQVTYLTDDTTYVPAVEAVVTEDIQGTGGSGGGADSWGSVQADGTLEASFNVASVTKTATGKYDVVFTTSMPTDDYSLAGAIQSSDGLSYVFKYSGATKSGFTANIAGSGGALNDKSFSFIVHASSTVTPTYTWTRDGTTLKPANDGDDVTVGDWYGGTTAFGARLGGAGNKFRGNTPTSTILDCFGGSGNSTTNGMILRVLGTELRIGGYQQGGGTEAWKAKFTRDGILRIGGTLTDATTDAKITLNPDGSAYFGGDKGKILSDGKAFFQGNTQVAVNSSNVNGADVEGVFLGVGGVTTITVTDTGSSRVGFRVFAKGSTSNRAVIFGNGNMNLAGTLTENSSDQKFKTNIVAALSQWDDIKALQFKKWDWNDKAPGTEERKLRRNVGLVAQEAELVDPKLVYDVQVDEVEGNTYKAIDQSVLTMKLLGALQESITRIETLEETNASLEARLTALEGGNN